MLRNTRTLKIAVIYKQAGGKNNSPQIKIKDNQSDLFMTLDITKSLEIIETMENYIDKIRPSVEIRHKIDIGYELKDQSVILHEIRPKWNDPKIVLTHDYAKATFVLKNNLWKVFWMRSNLKWNSYKPKPTVRQLKDFLKLVDEDKHHCFKG